DAPAERQLVEPAERQLVEPAERQLVEPAERQLVEPAERQLVEPAERQLVEPAERQLVEPAERLSKRCLFGLIERFMGNLRLFWLVPSFSLSPPRPIAEPAGRRNPRIWRIVGRRVQFSLWVRRCVFPRRHLQALRPLHKVRQERASSNPHMVMMLQFWTKILENRQYPGFMRLPGRRVSASDVP